MACRLFLLSATHPTLDDLLKKVVMLGRTKEIKELIAAGANINTVWEEGMNSLMIASYLGHVDVVKYLLSLNRQDDMGSPHEIDENEVIYDRGYYITTEPCIESTSVYIDINYIPKEGRSALMYASEEGHTEIVALLLEGGAKAAMRSDSGLTAVILASANGHCGVVQLLLLCGADVNDAHYVTGLTPLLTASQYGHFTVVQTLLMWGADINRRLNNGQSALVVASWRNYPEVVWLLLEEGADVDSCTHDGKTALLHSSYLGYAESVRFLLDAGANVNAVDMEGTSSLLIATQNAHWAVVRLLLEREADVNLSYKGGTYPLIMACMHGNSDIVRLLVDKGSNINVPAHNGLTPLIQAAQSGHSDVVSLLLTNGALVDLPAHNGRTALIQASQRGFLNIVNILLQSGANIEAVDFMGTTSLCVASQFGHTATVGALLHWGANVDTHDDKGVTSLREASQHGHIEIVKLLLDHGADVNAAENSGWSSLHVAIESGHMAIVQLLLKYKAEANTASKSGHRPLLQASLQGHTEAVRLLLEHGADVNLPGLLEATALLLASEAGHTHIVNILLGAGADVNVVANQGRTALMQASLQGHNDVVRALLEAGADANVVPEDGMTALLQATQQGHTVIVRTLLEAGASVNVVLEDGMTALSLATLNEHIDTLELLLECHANVKDTNWSGWGSLHHASSLGHREIARVLLDKGADVNAYTSDGATTLLIASERGYCDVVRLLLERGAEVNLVNRQGFTPLIAASMQGNKEVVELLLQNGAKVNMAVSHGDHSTALTFASQMGYISTAKLLLQGHTDVTTFLHTNRADVNLPGPGGYSPLLLASQNGHPDMVRLLVQHGADVNQLESSGKTALIQAAQGGHSKVVSLLVQAGASVNLASHSGRTALIQASQNGHTDAVTILLDCGADVSIADELLTTAVVAAAASGHWKTLHLLLASGGDPHHSNMNGETGAMYIAFGETSGVCDNIWDKYVKGFLSDSPPILKSHYGMSALSLILLAALQHNMSIPDHFLDVFSSVVSDSTVSDSWLYGYLPEQLHGYAKNDECFFQPYEGVEGKISLHSLQTAMLCKLPPRILPSATNENPVNMLGQTPLHLIAMENHYLANVGDKIHYMVHTIGLNFSQPDANGRLPYHIACMCLNAHFLQCALHSDPDIGLNIQKKDNIGIGPLEYMLHRIQTATDPNNVPMLRKLSAQRCLELLSGALSVSVISCTQGDCVPLPEIEQTLKGLFQHKTQLRQLTSLEEKCLWMFLGTGDLKHILCHKGNGIVDLYEKPNEWLIVMVLHLLQKISDEVATLDPMFMFRPSVKGSLQEATKCGLLDEMDASIVFVNFTKYFEIDIRELDLKTTNHIHMSAARVTPLTKNARYWNWKGFKRFYSMQFCADFWKVFLDALQKIAVQNCMKKMRVAVENCKRKNGYVGMLTLSYKPADCIQLISVDLAPCVQDDQLDGYIALLRPRHSETRMVGEEYHRGLELSSSQKDWNLLQCLPYEVLCGYTLVKVLRSLTGPFETASGAIYDSDAILPSYMLKTGLLWVLDPDEQLAEIYPGMHKLSSFIKENRSSYDNDIRELCQQLLEHVKETNVTMETKEMEDLHRIHDKCQCSTENLSAEERVLPYLLIGKYQGNVKQNGIDLSKMIKRTGPQDVNHNQRILARCSPTSFDRKITMCHDSQHSDAVVHNDTLPDCSHPPLTEDTVRKARLWALRILRMLSGILKHGPEHQRPGIRNYYLPEQEIHVRDRDLTIGICRALESLLHVPTFIYAEHWVEIASKGYY